MNNFTNADEEKEIAELVEMLDNLALNGSERINIQVSNSDSQTSITEDKFSGRCRTCSDENENSKEDFYEN